MNYPLHNLDDLVRVTGFSKRQIRFYITKKLVPSAKHKGPNAVYPDETLRRLLRIAELKQWRIGPTGRRVSLEEIRHELDEGEAVGSITDEAPVSFHLDFLRPVNRPPADPSGYPFDAVREDNRFPTPGPIDDDAKNPELRAAMIDLLNRLTDQIEDLADHAPPAGDPHRTGDGIRTERWHRIAHPSLPDIEIHVRQPQRDDGRNRMETVADVLRNLLETEDDQ